MSKQKGFTLIEIIGVVVILSLLLILTVPSLTKTLKRNEQNKYNDYIDNLKIAAENYVVEKLKSGDFFEENKDYNYISLGNLIDAGYIKNIITNPSNKKILARDTRIKIVKRADNTFEYDIQEYYNNSNDYNQDNLIIHYDSVEYSSNNTFKSLTSEVDYDYSAAATWTENGVLFDKTKSTSSKNLNTSYSTDSITVSYNLNSLEEYGTGGGDYTYPLYLYGNSSRTQFGHRKNIGLFYQTVTSVGSYNTVLNGSFSLNSNKNYTITYVQDGSTIRKMYINGNRIGLNNNLSLPSFDYNEILISPKLYNIKINNMLIYNRALSAEEIKELYELDKERFGE